MEVVLTELLDGGVGLLTLNNPDRMNAWSPQIADAFFEGLNRFDKDPDCRVIVVTGKGRAFCAGADAQGRFDKKQETEQQRKVRLAREEAKATWRIKRFHDLSHMNQPVIACINGGCVGIGLSLALACDMRFAAADAKIGVIFPQRGLIAEDGMGYFLPHLVGTGSAMMLLLTGDVLRAEELPQGIVQKTYPKGTLIEETLAFARKLATHSSPTAMSVIKQQIYTLPHLTLKEAQSINDRIQAASLQQENPDHEEGFAAFTGKRTPNFNALNQTLPYYKLARQLLRRSNL